ncbi:hypothetical protein QAD02_014077 [Eretmocerus hayati]|uniref:Uncharacterized protein n=1 Tax=Eretmocerus hayati TaxID=131215 RepID=A0ACC2P4H8_9HYME|nr:hypothetical protein QAD02_014077 [Eretmocerus hayati]
MQPFMNNDPQIAERVSSQSNEAWNNTVCSKHSKSVHLAGSESHGVRVTSAVCQKDMGYVYIVEVNKKLHLSSGSLTMKNRKRKDETHGKKYEKSKTIPAKSRRLELKRRRSSKQTSAAAREGISYQLGSSYLNTANLIDEVVIAEHTEFSECEIVIYDIETTGFHPTQDHIIQIAASTRDDKTFEAYIMPTRAKMSDGALQVTGITISGDRMYLNGEEVITSAPREGFMQFLYFLKSMNKPCILVAHNNFKFDSIRMITLVQNSGPTKEFKLFVGGFCDSYPLFQSILVERKESKLSFKLTDLAGIFKRRRNSTSPQCFQ